MIGWTTTVLVTSRTDGDRDELGSPSTVESTHGPYPASISQTTTRELTGDTYATVTNWNALLPPDVPLDHTDAVTDQQSGQVFEVATTVVRRGPAGPHHRSATLELRDA